VPPETLPSDQSTEINRGYLEHIRAWSGARIGSRWRTLKDRLFFGNELRVALFPLTLMASALLLLALRLSNRWHGRNVGSPLHRQALDHVESFIQQYPLHVYPIVAKALELAYLRDRLSRARDRNPRILEVAIGEGSMSARLFGDGQRVTGIDLNPYSLLKASVLPHVDRAIVCDGLNPPLRPGTFDLLLSVNFLHHVSQKELTVTNWSRLAEVLLITENTPYWASSWTVPYLLRRLGLRALAARRTRAIVRHGLQFLEDAATLEHRIERSCDILERVSFMSERTFFLCSILSFLMRCYGPPTPPLLKRWSLGPLRRLVLPLTAALARRLVVFDAYQHRPTDTFVMFLCRSRDWRQVGSGNDLICPTCRAELDLHDRCEQCGHRYSRIDGMLFLLPRDLQSVSRDYRPAVSLSLSAEHL
jgi:hypothetical protein